jgi:hypothetical protein
LYYKFDGRDSCFKATVPVFYSGAGKPYWAMVSSFIPNRKNKQNLARTAQKSLLKPLLAWVQIVKFGNL